MSAVEDDEYFPRGGQTRDVQTKKRHFVFEKKNKYGEPKKKLGRRERNKFKRAKFHSNEDSEEKGQDNDDWFSNKWENPEENSERSISKDIKPLNYQSLLNDMVVLCSVGSVFRECIKVFLPERLLCTILLNDISTPLNNEIAEVCKPPARKKNFNLDKIMKVGDIVACKIKRVTRVDNKIEVFGSTDPAAVNSHLSSDDVLVDSVLLAAVKSVEDHGYVMFSGISGLNMFLPFSKCRQSTNEKGMKSNFAVGKLLWCKIVRVSGDAVKNVQVSIDENDLTVPPSQMDVYSTKLIHPGMTFNLTVLRHLGGSLLVKVKGTDVIGCVASTQLPTIEHGVDNFEVGSEIQGTVLFKYPISLTIAFSLKVKLDAQHDELIENGEIFMGAEIVHHDHRGIGVKFEKNGKCCYGAISRRKMEGDMTDQNLEELFPIGNHLNVAVIGHHHIDQLYTCSTKNELLSGKILTGKQLKQMTGSAVDVKVVKLSEHGAIVTVNNKSAFVPATQITDAVSSNPLKKLRVKGSYKGRILTVNPEKNSIIVTLRPTLVNSEPLIDFEKLQKGDSYYGSVVSIVSDHIVVEFFNGLRGKVFQQNLIQDSCKYVIGELVKCYVVKKEENHRFPVLSLVRYLDQMLFSIGLPYKLIVKASSSTGVACLTEQKSTVFNTTITNQLLSDHSSLWSKQRQALEPGATLDAHMFCFNNQNEPVFTLRESVREFFAEGGEKLLKGGFRALKKNALIPVLVSRVDSDGFYVSLPVPKYNRKILVAKSEMSNYGPVSCGDVVWMSVNNILYSSSLIELTFPSPLENKWPLKQWAVSNLIGFFKASAQFQTHRMGERVTGKATGIENKCLLEDRREGLISSILKVEAQTFSKGQALNLIVLFEDFSSRVVHLLESGEVDTSVHMKKGIVKKFSPVFIHERFFVGKAACGMLCFCPRYLHPASREPDVTVDEITSQLFLPIVLCDFYEGVWIGRLINNKQTTLDNKKEAHSADSSLAETIKKTRKRKQRVNGSANVKKAKMTLVQPGNPFKPVSAKSDSKRNKKEKRKKGRRNLSESSSSEIVPVQ